MHKLYIFDMNGTFTNVPFKDGKPLYVLPGRKEKFTSLRMQGKAIAVATNQAGLVWHIATGQDKYPTVQSLAWDLRRIMNELTVLRPEENDPWYISLYDARAAALFPPLHPEESKQLLTFVKQYRDLSDDDSDEKELIDLEVDAWLQKNERQTLYWLQQEMFAAMEGYNIQVGIDADWREPNPGMLKVAMSVAQVTRQETLYIGDLPEDELAAKNAGCDFMYADEFFGEVE